QVDTWHVAFQRTWVAIGAHAPRFDGHAQALQKIRIGVVPRHGQHKIVLQDLNAFAARRMHRRDQDAVGPYLDHLRVEEGSNLAILYSVLNVGPQPVLDLVGKLRAAVNERNAGAAAVEFQGRHDGRIPSANDGYIRVVIGMRFGVVVRDFGQILARYAHHVREVVIASGYDQLLRAIAAGAPFLPFRQHFKVAVRPRHLGDFLILVNIQAEVLCDHAVVLERLQPARLLPQADHWYVANLQQFRSGKEDHVYRIMKNGIDDAALLQHQ